MKNALLAILIIFCFSSCYREKPVPDKRAQLSKHKWYLKSKAIANKWIDADCAVTQELTLNKDCTGVINNGSCDPRYPGSFTFEWYLSSDTYMIRFKRLDTKVEFARFTVSSVYDDELLLNGYFEGDYVNAVYKDVKQEP